MFTHLKSLKIDGTTLADIVAEKGVFCYVRISTVRPRMHLFQVELILNLNYIFKAIVRKASTMSE